MDTFDTSSLEACPAYCKINNVKNYKRFFCDHKTVDDLKIIPHTGDAVLIKSPKYDCNETYPKGFMCVYSVKLSCRANSLVVSHYDMNLLENDFIQVIDGSNAYSPITGDSWPADQPQQYSSTNLKVVFWSDRDEAQGKGFSLQFSCPSSTTEEVPSQQPGSGESIDILTTV